MPAELHVLFWKRVLLTVTVEFQRAIAPAESPKLFVKLLSRTASELDSLA